MFSIGQLSKRTGVKVPTIRYYEQMGLLAAPERTEGNQRRYGAGELQQLGFIKHARDLGHPDRTCGAANAIAEAQLEAVRDKISQLRKLEGELDRIVGGCDGAGPSSDCYVLASLADHGFCSGAH
jgi:DNA-binding transcriptional MerR regulator